MNNAVVVYEVPPFKMYMFSGVQWNASMESDIYCKHRAVGQNDKRSDTFTCRATCVHVSPVILVFQLLPTPNCAHVYRLQVQSGVFALVHSLYCNRCYHYDSIHVPTDSFSL